MSQTCLATVLLRQSDESLRQAETTLLGDVKDAGEMVGTYLEGDGTPHGLVVTAPRGTVPALRLTRQCRHCGYRHQRSRPAGEWVDGAGLRRGFVATPSLFADGFESGNFSAWSGGQP